MVLFPETTLEEKKKSDKPIVTPGMNHNITTDMSCMLIFVWMEFIRLPILREIYIYMYFFKKTPLQHFRISLERHVGISIKWMNTCEDKMKMFFF